MTLWQSALIVFCVGGGAVLGILPFLLEYHVWSKNAENASVHDAVGQINKVQDVAKQITAATAQWQNVQDTSEKTATLSRETVERMGAEMKGFSEFLARANDAEKANLRLETEKLRRAEQEWLQILVRIMDHIFALHQGALRSGQANVIAQVGNFQNSCRDVARRVGLTPILPEPGQAFTSVLHHLPEGEPVPANGAAISETVAAGWSFQGKLLRPALVRIQNGASGPMEGQPELEMSPREKV